MRLRNLNKEVGAQQCQVCFAPVADMLWIVLRTLLSSHVCLFPLQLGKLEDALAKKTRRIEILKSLAQSGEP